MSQLSIEELRQCLLEILIHFDEFCQKNNLHYSLGEGTLIGAVRHRGFIPWDDDLDVLMLREDYDKFISIHRDSRYKLISSQNNKLWPYQFSRLSDSTTEVSLESAERTMYHGGVWIDILPIDHFPDEKEKFIETEKRIYRLSKLYRARTRINFLPEVGLYRNMSWLAFRIVLSVVPISKIRRNIYRLMVSENNSKTKTMGYWTNYWHSPWVFASEIFVGYTQLEFEGKTFSAFIGYDAYLRSQYGDYMILPPEEKQVMSHSFTAYYKNKI